MLLLSLMLLASLLHVVGFTTVVGFITVADFFTDSGGPSAVDIHVVPAAAVIP
jgi:hypothetical protein